MSTAFDVYTKLKHTATDEERAEVIAQAFDALEARFPQITDLATQGHLRETELKLQKEIREVEARLQKEIREVEARLLERIKGVELQIREVDARLQKEIREVDARLQERIGQLEVSLHKALAAQTRWLIGGLAILGVVLKLADLMIGP
jgi:alanyl-tRNA synthetase